MRFENLNIKNILLFMLFFALIYLNIVLLMSIGDFIFINGKMFELFTKNILLGLGDESYYGYGLYDINVNFSDSNSNSNNYNSNLNNNDNNNTNYNNSGNNNNNNLSLTDYFNRYLGLRVDAPHNAFIATGVGLGLGFGAMSSAGRLQNQVMSNTQSLPIGKRIITSIAVFLWRIGCRYSCFTSRV